MAGGGGGFGMARGGELRHGCWGGGGLRHGSFFLLKILKIKLNLFFFFSNLYSFFIKQNKKIWSVAQVGSIVEKTTGSKSCWTVPLERK